MAKNISLLGADYPDVPAVVLPKTGGGSATFVDIDEINCKGKTIDLNAGGSYTHTLKDKAYIITMITSSSESPRIISIIKLGSYYKLLELGKGTYQSYFTESLSSSAWSVSVTYRTVIQILEIGKDS